MQAPLRKRAPQEIFFHVSGDGTIGEQRETDSAWVAQLVERVLGKDEVTGSIPVPGSRVARSLRRGNLEGLERG